MPPSPIENLFSLDSACSLGDKVYLFACREDSENSIYVLHNPSASIASQELHWQVIRVPEDAFIYRDLCIFVPLNSTEIAILGGRDENEEDLGGVITFNTTSNEFKKVMVDEADSFCAVNNQSAKVYENSIFVMLEYATGF